MHWGVVIGIAFGFANTQHRFRRAGANPHPLQRPQRAEDCLHAPCAAVSYSGGGAGHGTWPPARHPPGQQDPHNKGDQA
ncbi:hypothetical protein CBM2587_B90544 [Cupriavidus taiwanensis]|uniref:Uncharacterized protein n=1 Tax=Cupriavidus taiwanensis TaxID=164546 RepID=A0A375CDF5_9BURK|nr:hypothetical protein CBM2587_B90544 [Cupriavidus taiwanensis]